MFATQNGVNFMETGSVVFGLYAFNVRIQTQFRFYNTVKPL